MYNKSPFADWVPKPVMLLLIGGILLPMMTVTGVYSSAITNISGALATYTEYISLASNAGTIGMGVAISILSRIKSRFRSKEIIATCAILLAILSYMCGTTDSPIVLICCSFLIGFFKMFPLIEMVLQMMFILSPSGDKGRFYALFYPISIGFGQLSGYIFAKTVYDGSWQSPYLLMSAVMLVVAVLSLIFQHNQRFCFKMPLYQLDWFSLVLLAASFMCFNYFFVFMKQQGWFNSRSIVGALIGGVLLSAWLLYRQKSLKRKIVDITAFGKKNVIHGSVLLLFLGIYMAGSSVYTQYVVGVLGYNNLINAEINLWMIPGIVIAGIMGFFGFKNNWYIKYYIAAGFICFFLNSLCLYLIIQPQMDVRYLEYSMILKGMGMGILFIGVWFYALLNLTMNQLMGMMSILIVLRSFLAAAIGGALISWASYQAQWQSLSDISNHLDIGIIPNGMAIYGNISLNALMASSKIILGTLCWLIVPILIYVGTHRYGKFYFRRLVLLRKRIRGNATDGYRLS